jgi:hypothetical protein
MATAQLAFEDDKVPQADGSMRRPPVVRSATGFSGRRFCKIFPDGKGWALQLMDVGWAANEDEYLVRFASLSAAISYAVRNDYSYRVVHPQPAIHTLQPRKDSDGRRAGRSA